MLRAVTTEEVIELETPPGRRGSAGTTSTRRAVCWCSATARAAASPPRIWSAPPTRPRGGRERRARRAALPRRRGGARRRRPSSSMPPGSRSSSSCAASRCWSAAGRARVACRTAAETGTVAVLCLAFPVHPPGRPEKSRLDELDAVSVPVLVVQGERDPFGMPPEAPGRTVAVVAASPDSGGSRRAGCGGAVVARARAAGLGGGVAPAVHQRQRIRNRSVSAAAPSTISASE